MSRDHRHAFHARIDELNTALATMGDQVPSDLLTVADALESAAPHDLSAVREQWADVEARSSSIQQSATFLIATQQPVAADLRAIVAISAIAAQLDRSGHLVSHVAEIVERWDAPPVTRAVQELATETAAVYEQALACYRAREANAVSRLRAADDVVDDLSAELYNLVETEMRGASPRAIIDVGLIGRHFERIADHAVTIADRTTFVAGGPPPAAT